MKEILLSLFGLLFVYFGIKAIAKARNLKRNGVKTLATVVSTRQVSNSNRDADDVGPIRYMYSSTVKFTTQKNELIEVELGDSSSTKDAIGSKRKIIYNPQFPEEVALDTAFSLIIGPGSALGIGLLMFIWGVLEMLAVINIIK